MDRWFERMFEDFWRRPLPGLRRPERWWPAEAWGVRMPVVDVFEEKGDVLVKAELPGLSKEDVQVQITGSVLTLNGENEQEEVKEEDDYFWERSLGSFARSLELRREVKADEVKASFKDEVLEVRMPKTGEAKRKSVTVKID